MPTAVACLIYVAAFIAANLIIAAFGPWVSPINSFLLIGLDLSLRDHLHDSWRGRGLWPRMGALILIASGASYILNPASGQIALASFVAFAVAGLIDTVAYHLMRDRPYMQRVNGSNVAAAAVDSVLFPTLAFGSFMPVVILGQFGAKIVGGFLWALVLRHPRLAA